MSQTGSFTRNSGTAKPRELGRSALGEILKGLHLLNCSFATNCHCKSIPVTNLKLLIVIIAEFELRNNVERVSCETSSKKADPQT